MSDDGWTWELSATAEDDLDGLFPADQDRILDKLDEIVSSPWRDPPDYGEPLRNSPYKKIHIGEFRLSVSFRQDDGRLVVARIKCRCRAYTVDDDCVIEDTPADIPHRLIDIPDMVSHVDEVRAR